MCGIFGVISKSSVDFNKLEQLAKHARQRGRDSSGLLCLDDGNYTAYRADYDIIKLIKRVKSDRFSTVLGHSRLITNGLSDNQPVVRDGIAVLHNGIIVNDDEIWAKLKSKRRGSVDSEVIAAIAAEHISADAAPR